MYNYMDYGNRKIPRNHGYSDIGDGAERNDEDSAAPDVYLCPDNGN